MKFSKKNNSNRAYQAVTLIIFIGVIYFYLQYASEPLLGWYGSREVQTAITAYWFDFHHLFKSLFFYETPLFGSPWSIPFEFPLFQLGAASVHSLTGMPLDQSGRWLSSLLFFCCFIPLYNIIKEIGLDKEYFYISAILLLLSPLYLYWSRAFLIESSALFTGFLFLWSSIRFSKTNCIQWIFWMFVFGVLCSLIKITTFPTFVLAAFFSLVVLNSNDFSVANIKGLFLKMVSLFVVLILCFIAVKLWTEQADKLKLTNEIGRALTSKNLQRWNFGSLPQCFSSALWKSAVIDRMIPHAIGSISCLFIIAVGIVVGNNNQKGFIVFLLLLFVAPILIFTNLHIVHDYYQYANSFWLVLCLSFSLYIIKIRVSKLLFLILFIFVCWSDFSRFQQNYKKYIVDINAARNDASNQERLDIANKVRNSTPNNSIIVLFGEDWGAEIPFYAERKSLMIPNWISSEKVLEILQSKQVYGGLDVSAVVVNHSQNISLQDKEVLKTFLNAHKNLNSVIRLGYFDIYMNNLSSPY